MKTSFSEGLARLPGPATAQYPAGAPSATLLQHGSMRLLVFAPPVNPDGLDHQRPHAQDELYLVQRGSGEIVIDGARFPAGVGDAFFVAAGAQHRFEHCTPDFAAWVVFYGPNAGEAA